MSALAAHAQASHIIAMMQIVRRSIQVCGLLGALALGHSALAQNQLPTTCSCTCVDGRPQSICTNPAEISICTPDICPPKTPVLTPLPVPPAQQKVCTSQMVWNDKTNQYELKEVCK